MFIRSLDQTISMSQVAQLRKMRASLIDVNSIREGHSTPLDMTRLQKVTEPRWSKLLQKLQQIEQWDGKVVSCLWPASYDNTPFEERGKTTEVSHMMSKWLQFRANGPLCAVRWLSSCSPNNKRVSLGGENIFFSDLSLLQFMATHGLQGSETSFHLPPNLESGIKKLAQHEKEPILASSSLIDRLDSKEHTVVQKLMGLTTEDMKSLISWWNEKQLPLEYAVLDPYYVRMNCTEYLY